MQGNLVTLAYSVYCFGFKQGTEKKERWDHAEFCKRIKEAHQEGAKLWQHRNALSGVSCYAEQPAPLRKHNG